MGLMLSVLVMCVGVLEAISSAQQIRESFLPLDTIRKKRRMVVDHGTGNVRHVDISWPGDIPRGSHVIKKRSGLTSPHSSFDAPEDGHVSRRCSEHFDSAQLERAVSAILLEEDNSSDETSEEVTQILSGIVQSRIEFPTLQSGLPKKIVPRPETSSHDTFAPINEPRHDAERVPGKQPLLASEADEADIVDLKPTERLIKYPSAETVLDDDSSESSEKYSPEKISVSKSETSVSYGSELPSSSLSSEILADEGCKSRPFDVPSVSGNEVADTPEKNEIATYGKEPHKIKGISEVNESTNHVQVAENTVDICCQQQLMPKPEIPQQEDLHTNENRQSLSETQVLSLRNDDEPISNESEPSPPREAIVELIESTNSVVFSEDARPKLQHSDSIVELIQSTNSLVFVPDSVSQAQQNEEVRVSVDRQESIEKLIKSTNNVVFEKVIDDQDLIPPNKEIKNVRSSNFEGSVLNELSNQDTSLTDQDGNVEKRNATSRAVVLAEGKNGRTSFIHEPRDETREVSTEIPNNKNTGLCKNNGFNADEDDSIESPVKTVSDTLLGIQKLTDQDGNVEKRNVTSRAVVLTEGEKCQTYFIHEPRDETRDVSTEISNNENTGLCKNNGFNAVEDDLIKTPVTTFSDTLLGIQEPDVARIDTDTIGMGEHIALQPDLTDPSTYSVQQAVTTVSKGLTKVVKIVDDALPLNVTSNASSSDQSATLSSSEGIDREELRSVNRPIQSSSSSEEEDSANSVTTIITECVQTIIDIGPPSVNEVTENKSSDHKDVDEMLRTAVSKPRQERGLTQEIPKEIEYIESVALIQDEEKANQMELIGVANERKNSGLFLENSTSECPPEPVCVDVLNKSSENHVNNATSSPESKLEPTVVIRKLPSTNDDETIIQTILQLEKHQLILNDDFAVNSTDPTSTLSSELMKHSQKEYVIIEHKSEGTSKKHTDDVATSSIPTHVELHKENVESLNKGASQTEVIVSEKVKNEIASNIYSVEEKSISSHDVITAQSEVSTFSDFMTTTAPNKPNSAVLNSENLVSAACDDVVDTHKLAERVTKRENEDSALISDICTSDVPSSGVEIQRQSKTVSEVNHTVDAVASSQIDSQTISKTQTPKMQDSFELETVFTDDCAHKMVERATKTESKESVSVVDVDRTALPSSESEGVGDSGAVSEELQSSIMDKESSNTQTRQIRGTSERASDSTIDIPLEPAGGATKTDNKTPALVDNGKSTVTTRGTKVAEETLVVGEQIKSRDDDALKIDSGISNTFIQRVVDKPTEGAIETENTVSVGFDNGKSASTSEVTENDGKIPVVNKKSRSRDCADESSETENTVSVVVDNSIPAITSRVTVDAGETQVSGTVQSGDIGRLNTDSLNRKASHQQLGDKPARKAAETEEISSVPVDVNESVVESPASKVVKQTQIGIEKNQSRNAGTSKMDSRITKTSSKQLADSRTLDTDLQEKNEAKTRNTADGRPTNEIATDPNTSASEVKQEIRRVSSIDEGEVINVKASQDRTADMENVQDDPSSSPNKAFWLIFSGEYTKAMSKDWHSGHFCCWQCDESLTGQRYVLRDDHPYCIKCYESVFANTCDECNKTIGIDSKDLSYKDKHWHEACFFCNKCRVSLVDKQFGSKADKIYCGNCYDAQFASRCDGCGQIFRAGTKKMEYKTRQWHEQCFCCCVCKSAIGTKSFIPREQEIYCATCYEEKFATRCVKCNKIITSGGVTYKNEPWHRECFTCTNCNTSLAGQRFTSRDEKPYCADCFGELFAKRCTSCCKPITGIGGTRFISFEDRHWHNDCFICASCKTSLVGRGFITDAEDILCTECAKQKLM